MLHLCPELNTPGKQKARRLAGPGIRERKYFDVRELGSQDIEKQPDNMYPLVFSFMQVNKKLVE